MADTCPPPESFHFTWDLDPYLIHRVSKNVPPLACYNCDTHEWILTFFGTNVDKVSKQKTLYYATSNNLCFCITWQNGKQEIAFFNTRCISALPEFSQSLLDLRLILTLLYDSLNRVNNAFSLGLLRGMVQEKGSRERCSSWTVLHA